MISLNAFQCLFSNVMYDFSGLILIPTGMQQQQPIVAIVTSGGQHELTAIYLVPRARQEFTYIILRLRLCYSFIVYMLGVSVCFLK